MSITRLEIANAAYVLAREEVGAWQELARLDGGATALLPGLDGPGASDADIEVAIERAEDWLMPHAKVMAGDTLDVQDATGVLLRGLGRAGTFKLDEVESEFNRVVASHSGDARAPAFVAHLVLVRELAHHGRVAAVRLYGTLAIGS